MSEESGASKRSHPPHSFLASMLSGNATPLGFMQSQEKAPANKCSDRLEPTSYAKTQRGLVASRSEVNSGNQISARLRRAKPTPPITPSYATTPAILSQKFYILTYDAQNWHHTDTTDTITLLNGKSIRIGMPVDGDEPASKQCSGFLGLYLSLAAAEMMGHSWLYGQLKSIDHGLHMPLPRQDTSRCEQVTWKASGWFRSADGSWADSISDTFRQVGLTVRVTKGAVDRVKTAVGKEGREDKVVGGKKEGGGMEVVDLTGDGDGLVRKGWAGKRKREDAMSGEDRSRNGGFAQGRSVKKCRTREVVEEESEAASLLLTMKDGEW